MLLKHYNFKTAELKAYTFQNPNSKINQYFLAL